MFIPPFFYRIYSTISDNCVVQRDRQNGIRDYIIMSRNIFFQNEISRQKEEYFRTSHEDHSNLTYCCFPSQLKLITGTNRLEIRETISQIY